MIDPVIVSFELFGMTLALRWYGVIVMVGIVVGGFIVERGLKQRGEKSDSIWDAIVWVVPIGVIGARLWYVFNATLGGNRAYLEDPASILRIWEGGLHIFGGFLFGAIALLVYLRQNKLDPWLFLDAAGPAALIGQGIGRIANFINQELYGPPTSLPWGIPIEAAHRLPDFPTSRFPVETTRFHPTFAYELLWNFLTAGLLLWLSRRYGKQLKPGTIFAGWLLAAGLGRTWIELFFRTDQPQIGASGISYSAIFAALMALAGAVLLMVRYKALDFKFAENWEEDYQRSGDQKVETGEIEVLVEPVGEQVSPRKSKARTANATAAKGKLVRRKPARRTSKTTKKPAGAKKST